MSKKENVLRVVLPKVAKFRGIEVNDGVISVLYDEIETSGEVNVTTAGLWTQDRTTVTNGDVTLEVGSPITGYEACGISDWYVLGAEDGHLLIFAKSCSEKVKLSGRDGYINGVEILNNVAQKYTNSIYAEGYARSINSDDINRVTGYDPNTVAGYGANKIWQYGNKVTFYWDGSCIPYYSGSNGVKGKLEWRHDSGFHYPKAEEFICFQKSTTATESNKEEITTLTNTYYSYKVHQYLSRNGKAYKLLFKDKSYWLSPYVYCGRNAYFGFHYVYDGRVTNNYLATSDGDEASYSYGVLPVVSLKYEIQLDSDGKICK